MVTINGINRTQLNKIANKHLKELFTEKEISRCENCGFSFALSFAHRHKRKWYYDQPQELLWDFNQVLLLCLKCHDNSEYTPGETEKLFDKLRGKIE